MDERGKAQRLPYQRTANGQAIVTISGSLMNRGAYIGAKSGVLSYEGIAHQLKAAASAGYAIASGAKTITSTETGVSGSIGVVVQHMDMSRAADRAGVSVSYIHAGKHKVDGHQFAPLSQDVRAQLQAEVDKFYDLFVDTVAAGRGRRLSAKAARATEARTFIGQSAVEAGLADAVGSFDALLDDVSRPAPRGAKKRMTTMGLDVFNDVDLANAKAEGVVEGKVEGHATGFNEGKAAGFAEGQAAGKAEGLAEGAASERARITAIRNLADAEGREATAMHLALTTDLSVEAVAGVLAGVPKAAANTIAARSAETVVTVAADTGERVKQTVSLDREAIYRSVQGRR